MRCDVNITLFKRVKVKSPFFSIFLNKFLNYNIFFRIWILKATLKKIKCFKEPRGWKSVCKNKYAPEKTETFKMKLWLVKSSRLLQSAVFLVCFCFKLILLVGSVKVNFMMLVKWKKVHLVRDYSLFSFLVKKGSGDKITYKFMGRKAFF